MMRRLAATVLAGVVNLVGSPNLDAGVVDDAGDGSDGSVDVQWRTVVLPGEAYGPATSGTAAHGDVGLDGAWTAWGLHGQVAAAVGVKQRAGHVAAVGLPVAAGCPAWSDLMAWAFAFCRERESLKLLVESKGVPAHAVRALAETYGFQSTRWQHVDGVDVSEFYVDLYRRAPAAHDG